MFHSYVPHSRTEAICSDKVKVCDFNNPSSKQMGEYDRAFQCGTRPALSAMWSTRSHLLLKPWHAVYLDRLYTRVHRLGRFTMTAHNTAIAQT